MLISIIEELDRKIPKDLETIPSVIYFINMYCLVENGRKLETHYNIIGKVLGVLSNKEYIEVLSSSKGLIKGKCFDSLAMEYLLTFILYNLGSAK